MRRGRIRPTCTPNSDDNHLWDSKDGTFWTFHVNGWIQFGSLVRGYDVRAPFIKRWH